MGGAASVIVAVVEYAQIQGLVLLVMVVKRGRVIDACKKKALCIPLISSFLLCRGENKRCLFAGAGDYREMSQVEASRPFDVVSGK